MNGIPQKEYKFISQNLVLDKEMQYSVDILKT